MGEKAWLAEIEKAVGVCYAISKFQKKIRKFIKNFGNYCTSRGSEPRTNLKGKIFYELFKNHPNRGFVGEEHNSVNISELKKI